MLQLICGFIVKQSLQQHNHSPHSIQVIQKWPNDILLKQDGKIGKVCGVLIESISKGNVSETVIGIGINLSASKEMPVYEMPASFADSLHKEITRQILQSEIDCRLAGLFDDITNIPKANFLPMTNLASKSIIDGFTIPEELLYRNKKVSFHSVNSDGLVIVCDENNQQIICDEAESLNWNF
jgi:biotin-(acetyl-CoA carboxylase) ligase